MLCLEGGRKTLSHTSESYMVSLCLALLCLLLGPALLAFAHLAWLVAWLSCLPCRNWCNIIIITPIMAWSSSVCVKIRTCTKFSKFKHDKD
jgi:hypothetical protein